MAISTRHRQRPTLASLAFAVLIGVTAFGAAAADGGETHPIRPPNAPWSHAKPAMHLGLPTDQWVAESTTAPKTTRLEQCRRWTSVATSLGETFAGHALRSTLVRRHCSFIEMEVNETWDWPWNGLEQGSISLPSLHRAFGAWQIRCDIVGERRRCALMHGSAEPEAGPSAGPRPKPIVTHFVIDRVTGQEVLLWRLFVPAPSSRTTTVVDATGTAVPSAPPASSIASPTVRFSIADRRFSERFPACTPAGCMLEVRAARAGMIATDLAAGKSLVLDLANDVSGMARIVVPARGYQAGLAELIRLRRAETAIKQPR